MDRCTSSRDAHLGDALQSTREKQDVASLKLEIANMARFPAAGDDPQRLYGRHHHNSTSRALQSLKKDREHKQPKKMWDDASDAPSVAAFCKVRIPSEQGKTSKDCGAPVFLKILVSSFCEENGHPSLVQLKHVVRTALLLTKNNDASGSEGCFGLRYLDAEEDLVDLWSDEDLRDALQSTANKSGSLKLEIVANNKSVQRRYLDERVYGTVPVVLLLLMGSQGLTLLPIFLMYLAVLLPILGYLTSVSVGMVVGNVGMVIGNVIAHFRG